LFLINEHDDDDDKYFTLSAWKLSSQKDTCDKGIQHKHRVQQLSENLGKYGKAKYLSNK